MNYVLYVKGEIINMCECDRELFILERNDLNIPYCKTCGKIFRSWSDKRHV